MSIGVVREALAVMNVASEAGVGLFSAALAFATMFAVVPLLLLLSGVLGWLIDDPVQRASLLAQLVAAVPPLAQALEDSLESVVRQRGALSIVGLVGLLWGASSFYGSLDEVMRRLFPGGGVHDFVAQRLRGVIAILVLVGLIIGTISLGGVWAFIDQLVGGLEVWRYVVPLFSIGIVVLVALAVYRLVPTAPPGLRAAVPPAIVAGIGIGLLTNLFSALAPLLVGGLSGFGLIAAVFGAFIWLNFSFQILLFGAAWARVRRDHRAGSSPTMETP